MKRGHPIAYESRKLNDRERNYSSHEKEMTAIVHHLRIAIIIYLEFLLWSRLTMSARPTSRLSRS